MVWKEVWGEHGTHFGLLGRILVGLLVLVSFAPAVVIFFDTWTYSESWDKVIEQWNLYQVRVTGTAIACLTLLSVALRAATSITGERERQTFASLLSTPLESDTILFGKWLGSILSVRWGWVWLGAIWGFGLVTGSLHVLSIPLLLAAWLIFAAVLAGLGCWFSARKCTSLCATIWTLFMTAGLCFGHWLLVWHTWYWLFTPSTEKLKSAMIIHGIGLTPPITLGLLAFQGKEFEYGSKDTFELLAIAMMGLAFWAGVATLLWILTSHRFRNLAHRAPIRRRSPPTAVTPPAVKVSSADLCPQHLT